MTSIGMTKLTTRISVDELGVSCGRRVTFADGLSVVDRFRPMDIKAIRNHPITLKFNLFTRLSNSSYKCMSLSLRLVLTHLPGNKE